MGSSQSSNSGDFEKGLTYYPYFDANEPIKDQNRVLVEQKDLAKILNGDFPDIFEDETVKHVWIYVRDLRIAEGAIIGAMALASVATVASVLTLIPGINVVAFPVAAIILVCVGLSTAIVPHLNHQFVMFKTEKWLYVLSKGTSGCECFRAKHSYQDALLKVQQQYDKAERRFQSDPFPKSWRDAKGKVRLFDMIRWMEKERVIEKEYNWAGANCQGFAQSFFDFLTTRQTQ